MNIQSHLVTCERHNKHLAWAIKKMANFMPITGVRFEKLSEEELYPLHLKMRFLASHLASRLKRSSIEKSQNAVSIP